MNFLRFCRRRGSPSEASRSSTCLLLLGYLPVHKNIEVRLVEGGGPALLEKVERGELHLAVTVPLNPGLQTRQLFSMRTLAVTPASRIANRGETVRLEDLIDQPLLMLRRGFVHRNVFDAACELMQIQPNIVYESAIPQTLLALARSRLPCSVPTLRSARRFPMRHRPRYRGSAPYSQAWCVPAKAGPL